MILRRSSKYYIACIAASIILSGLAVYSHAVGAAGALQNVIALVTVPMTSAFDGLCDYAADIGDYFGSIKELKAENDALRAENRRLAIENEEAKKISAENEKLYEFMDLKRERTDIHFINAEIVARSEGNFMTSFTLDRGTFHGIDKNMAVITEDSVLGVITEAGATYSKGISVIGANISAGVVFKRTGLTATLDGSYDYAARGRCRITGVPTTADVEVGDLVYTSGYGDVYPKDLLIGEVDKIVPDALTYTLEISVKPAANFDDADTVMVITGFDRTYN